MQIHFLEDSEFYVITTQRMIAASLLVALAIGTLGCSPPSIKDGFPNPIVGAWLVLDPNAPFPYHMYVFNADGTMQQANPDAGDSHASDSDGKGIWVATDGRINGKWVEVIADRATRQFAGRLEVSYEIAVSGDTYTATEVVRSYDAAGNSTGNPASPANLVGQRVTLP